MTARRRNIGLAVMAVLAGLWLVAASRVHVNASWSDEAWGYAVVPLFGEDPGIGDRVLFDPPEALGAEVPWLKTVRGLPGTAVAVDEDGAVTVGGVRLGRAKTHALDGRPLAAIAAGTIPPGHYFLHADHRRQPRQPLCGGRPGAPRAHSRPRGRPARPALARPGRAAGRAGRRAMMRVFHLSGRALAAVLSISTVLSVLAMASDAKDLGVRGATWPVAEPDLLVEIEARLGAMQRSGELARIEREARSRARSGLEEPQPVPDIAPAREHRSRMFDPAIVVERDIRLPDGTLIAAAGTRVNPLASHALSRDLLFVDGRRDAEIAWALKHARPAKIVLLAGRPLDLARRHRRPFFFDQGGRLAARFGIAATPALVEQAGSQLRITEIPVEDRDASKPEREE